MFYADMTILSVLAKRFSTDAKCLTRFFHWVPPCWGNLWFYICHSWILIFRSLFLITPILRRATRIVCSEIFSFSAMVRIILDLETPWYFWLKFSKVAAHRLFRCLSFLSKLVSSSILFFSWLVYYSYNSSRYKCDNQAEKVVALYYMTYCSYYAHKNE